MKYPDLYYIEKVFLEEVKKAYPEIFNKEKTKEHKCRVNVFPQTWASTATGFNLESVYSGQAFTDEYTTVISLYWWEVDEDGWWNPKDDVYGVFFGDKLAYFCKHPNEKFQFDLENRQMRPQKTAGDYINDGFREYRDLSFS